MQALLKLYCKKTRISPSTILTLGVFVILTILKICNAVSISWLWIIIAPIIIDVVYSLFFVLDFYHMDKVLNTKVTYVANNDKLSIEEEVTNNV